MAARRCKARCAGTRERQPSFSAVKFIRRETWWTTCRTNTEPTCEGKCRTHTRWWITATQAGAGAAASGVDRSESERGAQFGGRNGRDAHRSQAARAGTTPSDSVQHERDRVGFFYRGYGLPKREPVDVR